MEKTRINVNKPVVLTRTSSEEEIGKVIDWVKSSRQSKNILVELLSERHSVYEERPSYQMTRIKGYAMASFAEVGLPDSALNFVLDELQNGKNAYMVAAAARGLRGTKQPGSQYVSFLLRALDNIRDHDDRMNLDVFKPSWPLNHYTTAKKEIFRGFQWLQGYAKGALPELRLCLQNAYAFDVETNEEIQKAIECIEKDTRKLDVSCCEIQSKAENSLLWLGKGVRNSRSIGRLEVENQEGICRPLEELIDQKPTVVAFFYTRCMNPNKCTLTTNKLGWLQQELVKYNIQEKVNLLAFTYDPSYDTPAKMQVFGENRGMIFNPNVHMLRTKPEDFSLLSSFFELGVNLVASTVNQHRLELFLLDQKGTIRITYTRLQWEVEKVLEDVKRLVSNSSRVGWLSPVVSCCQQVIFPILLAFFPKCPICWAVYLSAFGVSGLRSIPYSPWLIPWIIGAIATNLVLLYRKAGVRNGLTPFWISLVGGILVICSGYLFASQHTSILGVVLIMVGAIFNSLSYPQWVKLSRFTASSLKAFKKRFQLQALPFSIKNMSNH